MSALLSLTWYDGVDGKSVMMVVNGYSVTFERKQKSILAFLGFILGVSLLLRLTGLILHLLPLACSLSL